MMVVVNPGGNTHHTPPRVRLVLTRSHLSIGHRALSTPHPTAAHPKNPNNAKNRPQRGKAYLQQEEALAI